MMLMMNVIMLSVNMLSDFALGIMTLSIWDLIGRLRTLDLMFMLRVIILADIYAEHHN